MPSPILLKLLILAIMLLFLPLSPTAAQTLNILTSYQDDVVKPMQRAFEERHPGIKVRFLNKNTHAAVDELLAGNPRRFDLFWASAPEAFVLLDHAGRLLDQGRGSHVDFAYSAAGWAWQSPYDGGVPQEWNDLLDPALAGKIAMSHPMRSGTMHSLIEAILQDRGWEAGWAYLLELAPQLNTISARSFGVLEGVSDGDFLIGLTIDYLALTRAPQGIAFHYGRPIIIVPARIAALRGAAQPDAAHSFVDLILSPEGQRILLRPDIRRIPVDPAIRAELAEALHPGARAALSFSWSRYNPELAASRYWQVNQLFETFLSRDLLLRRDLWRRLRALENPPAAERSRIHRLLTWMPLTEHQAGLATRDGETVLAWSGRAYAILQDADALLRELEQAQ